MLILPPPTIWGPVSNGKDGLYWLGPAILDKLFLINCWQGRKKGEGEERRKEGREGGRREGGNREGGGEREGGLKRNTCPISSLNFTTPFSLGPGPLMSLHLQGLAQSSAHRKHSTDRYLLNWLKWTRSYGPILQAHLKICLRSPTLSLKEWFK